MTCAAVAGLAAAFGNYLVAAVAAVICVLAAFAWPWWQHRYDARLRAKGVVVDRSVWHREQILKGDRQAKWLAFYLLGSIALIGVAVIAWSIAKAT